MSTITIGSDLPSFDRLKSVDGKLYDSESFSESPLLLVVFSCNHCPYVKAYEDRMIALTAAYESKGLAVVAINSNDDKNYPEDGYEEMKKRALEKKFNFPYVRDEDQSAAKAFGAMHTPEFFLFDAERKLRYHGRFDDNWREPDRVTRGYLREAIDALLDGREVGEPEAHAIGCTIKWKY